MLNLVVDWGECCSGDPSESGLLVDTSPTQVLRGQRPCNCSEATSVSWRGFFGHTSSCGNPSTFTRLDLRHFQEEGGFFSSSVGSLLRPYQSTRHQTQLLRGEEDDGATYAVECEHIDQRFGFHVGRAMSLFVDDPPVWQHEGMDHPWAVWWSRAARKFGQQLGGEEVFSSSVFWQAVCKIAPGKKDRSVEPVDVCRGEATGVLIGPDIVLTNEHVIGLEGPRGHRFDYCVFGAYIRFQDPWNPSSLPTRSPFDLPDGVQRIKVIEVIESSKRELRDADGRLIRHIATGEPLRDRNWMDWAILRLESAPVGINPLRLRTRIPTWAAQIGYPAGGLEKVIFGELSDRIVHCGSASSSGPCVEVDYSPMASRGGMSGAPILDSQGFVVALHHSTASRFLRSSASRANRIDAIMARSQTLRQFVKPYALRCERLGAWSDGGVLTLISQSRDLIGIWRDGHGGLSSLVQGGRISDDSRVRAVNWGVISNGLASNITEISAPWRHQNRDRVLCISSQQLRLVLVDISNRSQPIFFDFGDMLGFERRDPGRFLSAVGWTSRAGLNHVSFVRTALVNGGRRPQLHDCWWNKREQEWKRQNLSTDKGAAPEGPIGAFADTIVYQDRNLGFATMSYDGNDWSRPVGLGIPRPARFSVVPPAAGFGQDAHIVSIDPGGQIWISTRSNNRGPFVSTSAQAIDAQLPQFMPMGGLAAWRESPNEIAIAARKAPGSSDIWLLRTNVREGNVSSEVLGPQFAEYVGFRSSQLSPGTIGSSVFTACRPDDIVLLDARRPNWVFPLAAFCGTPELETYQP